MSRIAVNDHVIYHQQEASTHPAPGARDVYPAERGELYSYVVDHFCRVVRVNPDGTIDVVDSAGRTKRVKASDTHLEKVRWWNRWNYRRFFPGV